jgi:Ca-activated chloride channel homolog
MHRIALLAAALAAGALTTAAQSPDKRDAIPTFGTSTELVYVRFHVEKKGGYLDALKPDQIRVLEDGRPQKIALLETPSTRERTLPPEVTLALDVSSSVMDERLLDETLVKDVLLTTLGDQARVGLCAFGGELRCLRPPTRDADALLDGFQEALHFAVEQRREGTRLYASLAELSRRPQEGARAQRALIVFSDGLDNRGGKVGEAIQAAAEGDVRIYSVLLSQAFQTSSRNAGFRGVPNRAMYDYKKFELSRLAEESGGRAFEPGTVDPKSLAKILSTIATEISMENVVGYQPEGAATGRKRHVKVELTDRSVGSIKDGERTLVR